jgi:hypothetical protein
MGLAGPGPAGPVGRLLLPFFVKKTVSFLLFFLFVLKPISNRFLEQKISKEIYFNLRQKERD